MMKLRVLKWATVMMEQLCDCTPAQYIRPSKWAHYTMSVTLPESYYLRGETVLHVITWTQLQQRPPLCGKQGTDTLTRVCCE